MSQMKNQKTSYPLLYSPISNEYSVMWTDGISRSEIS